MKLSKRNIHILIFSLFMVGLAVAASPASVFAYTPTGTDIGSGVVDTGTAFTVPWDDPAIAGCMGNPAGFRYCGGFRITRASDGAVMNGDSGLLDDSNWANYSAEANGYSRSHAYSAITAWTRSPAPGDGTYFYEIISGSGYNNGDPSGSHTAPTVAYFQYTITSGVATVIPPTVDERTRIDTVTPPHDYTGALARATSTVFAIESTGYINPSVDIDGVKIRISFYNDAYVPTNSLAGPAYSDGGAQFCNALWDWLCPPTVDDDRNIIGAQTSRVNKTFEFEATTTGAYNFATTTNIQQIGRYSMKTEILQPKFTFFGLIPDGYDALAATSTNFMVATSTWYDAAHDEAVALVESLSAGANTYNCEVNFSTLFGVLDIGDCIKYLFAGNDGIITEYGRQTIAGFMQRAPWGYATRVYTIFTASTTPATLPSIAADIPEGLPMAGSHFDFSPWEPTRTAIADLETRELPGPTTGTVMDNFLHWWNLIWTIIFALWVMKEIYGAYELGDFEDLGFVGGNAHGRIRKDVNGNKYQEYSTKDIKRFIKKGEKNAVIH